MKSFTRLGAYAGAAALLLIGAGCKPNLDVTNPNDPDRIRALATPDDVRGLAVSSMNSWYLTSTNLEPYLMFQVTADASTANFGNFGMRFNNLQPRIPYANTTTGNDRVVSQTPWEGNYRTLASSNDVLKALDRGISLGSTAETEKFKHIAMFTQAGSLTNLGLIFDRAFIVDEKADAATLALSPYADVSAAAVAKWEALIAATAGKSYDYSADNVLPTVGTSVTSTWLNRVANTMAALTLGYTPRNAAQAAAVNWAKVASLAAKGIGTGSAGAPFDIVVQGDGTNWYSYIAAYGSEESWTRVDMRLINMMDPNSPAEYSGPTPKGSSADARFESDFSYFGSPIGNPARGIYMQSQYAHTRHSAHSAESPDGFVAPVPYLLAAESDLMHAEALIRSNGSFATAASLINKTRVGRGNLSPALAIESAASLLAKIAYERDIELLNTSGTTLFQRRHIDGLRAGTLRHLPIPASELEVLGLPVYTFGGTGPTDKVESRGLTAGDYRSSITFSNETSTLRLPGGGSMELLARMRAPRPAAESRK